MFILIPLIGVLGFYKLSEIDALKEFKSFSIPLGLSTILPMILSLQKKCKKALNILADANGKFSDDLKTEEGKLKTIVTTIDGKVKEGEKALETAPSSVTLYDRLGEASCFLEGWKTSFGTGSDCPFILDRQTGERRECTYDDVSNGALVCDSLENFDFVMPVGIISDRPINVADVYEVEVSMKSTVKPIASQLK